MKQYVLETIFAHYLPWHCRSIRSIKLSEQTEHAEQRRVKLRSNGKGAKGTNAAHEVGGQIIHVLVNPSRTEVAGSLLPQLITNCKEGLKGLVLSVGGSTVVQIELMLHHLHDVASGVITLHPMERSLSCLESACNQTESLQ
jgi:hypothetical protein